MFVYEKFNEDRERHIYGTLGTHPSAEDSQLTYTDDEDEPITPELHKNYFDDGKGGIMDKEREGIHVYIDDTCIVPPGYKADAALEEITVTPPTKVNYVVGDKLDLTGFKVMASYSDDTEVDVTEDCTLNPDTDTPLTADDTLVTVTYEDKEDDFDIEVTTA